MSRTVTVSDIETEARNRSDMVSSTFVTSAVAITMIDASYTELYDLLIDNDLYFFSEDSFSTVADQADYTLPSDYYKTLGVDLVRGGDQSITLERFEWMERNRYDNAIKNGVGVLADAYMRYLPIGGVLRFKPTPQAGQTILHTYIPSPAKLTAGGDVIDGVSGWEEYLVVDVAAKMLEKEESDTTPFMIRKEALRSRIEKISSERDFGKSVTISDQRRQNWPWAV